MDVAADGAFEARALDAAGNRDPGGGRRDRPAGPHAVQQRSLAIVALR